MTRNEKRFMLYCLAIASMNLNKTETVYMIILYLL